MDIEEYDKINNMKQIQKIDYLAYLYQKDRKSYNKYFKMKRKEENKNAEININKEYFSPINLGL